MIGRALAVLGLLLLATAAGAQEAGGDEGPVELVTEQIILLATVIGAVATLPALIEFLIDRRKRKERIALSLDDLAVADLERGSPGWTTCSPISPTSSTAPGIRRPMPRAGSATRC
jgi:hypothetical protein